MNSTLRTITRFKFLFVALFVAFVGFTGGYWLFWERPAQRCEASGNWWDPQARFCATVVYLPDLTGRYEINGRRVQGPAQLPARPARAAAQPSA